MHSNWLSRATFDCEDDEGIYVFYTDMRIHVPPFWGGTRKCKFCPIGNNVTSLHTIFFRGCFHNIKFLFS